MEIFFVFCEIRNFLSFDFDFAVSFTFAQSEQSFNKFGGGGCALHHYYCTPWTGPGLVIREAFLRQPSLMRNKLLPRFSYFTTQALLSAAGPSVGSIHICNLLEFFLNGVEF